MFKSGEIVYHDNYRLNNGPLEIKIKRPSIILFETSINGHGYVCSCPLSTRVKSFNRYPETYSLIPESIFGYKKLSFARISSCTLTPVEETHSYGRYISLETVNKLLRRVREYRLFPRTEDDRKIADIMTYMDLFDKSEEREARALKKAIQKEKRRGIKTI